MDFRAQASHLDDIDPLAGYRDEFLIQPDSDVVSYLDGNSLGRPLRRAAHMLQEFVHDGWAGRLIRGWTDEWMDWPMTVGDQLGVAALGAAAGQTVVADSTTVMLYKLARAAVAARANRTEIVLDTDNFPTDRYVLEGIAAERGLRLQWIETDPDGGVLPEQVASVVGPQTALAVFSHVAYRSGHLADAPAITKVVQDSGALVCWDLSHSAGLVVVDLDGWGADLAVGCTYKYLNGGPGSPAFGYVAARHLTGSDGWLRQPIWGWMGRKDAFTMGAGYEPADGVRGLLSGTPPILAMVPLRTSLDLLAEVGMDAVRAKSIVLTEFALEIADAWFVPHGVRIASPRDPKSRGGHVTLQAPGFRTVTDELWRRGVIPDYREPDCMRIGLAPLSTSFAELYNGLVVMRDVLSHRRYAGQSAR